VLTHYLTVALGTHLRRPAATLLCVATLTLGLACFVTAYGVTAFWGRADRHFANAERIFAVTSEWEVRDVQEGTRFRSGVRGRTNPWLAQYLRADFPALEAVARVVPFGELPVRAEESVVRLRSITADAELLAIFDLPFAAGNARRALEAPASVVLTGLAAERLFGREPALGRTIVLGNGWDATVTGVLRPIPEPSHLGASASAPLRFDLLASFDIAERSWREAVGWELTESPEEWSIEDTTTYVLLPADGSLTAAALSAELPAFAARHVPPGQREAMTFDFGLVPVTELLGMAVDASLFLRQSGVTVSAVLLALGTLVLGVACLNFANLAAARTVRRAREVGLRKTLGATTGRVLTQHLLEVGLLVGTALAAALVFVAAAAPALERAAGIDLRLAIFSSGIPWAVLGALLAAVTVAAGAYPAWLLARSPAAVVLRTAQTRGGPGAITALLVATQFAVAAFLLIALAVAYSQNQRLEHAALGIAAAPLVVLENDESVTGLAQATLRAELLRLQPVTAATQLVEPPWTVPAGMMPLRASPEASAIARTALLQIVGEDFFTTFDVPLLAGRVFDSARAADVASVGTRPIGTEHAIVSRTLARELGFASPEEAVGRRLYLPNRDQLIIGVVEDKPINISTGFGPRPSVYLFNTEGSRFHAVQIDPSDIAGTLEKIDALWRRLVPDVPVARRFADEYFNDAYSKFVQVKHAFTGLALAALLIAATGLFAMALLAASRRVHEIGVRKTLGATTGEMVLMLLASFAKPVIVANVVAWPFAYVAVSAYLNVFIDPIRLTPAPFVGALAVTVLLSGIAVGGQALTAARTMPARVLRQG
jgi:putative ABC transport system permease protein